MNRNLVTCQPTEAFAPPVALGAVRNMVFFELFLYYFSPLFYDVLSLSTLFSQFHSSRKDNTRAIDPMT